MGNQLQVLGRERTGRHARLAVVDWVQRAISGEPGAVARVRVEPGPAVTLKGDPLRLEQALANLIRNADRKSTRLNSSHVAISYAVFCLKKKTEKSPARPTTKPAIPVTRTRMPATCVA